MKKERNNVVDCYDDLLSIKNKIARELADTQREKDLEVDKLNRKYEGKIDELLRKQKACDMQIELSKKYTAEN